MELKDNLFDSTDQIFKEWKELHNELSIADKKRSDVEHYIEFFNLNAAQGYKAYKMLKDILQERREIKNKIEELKPLVDFSNGFNLRNLNKRKQIEKRINDKIQLNMCSTESKRYQVRVMTEIFGDVMKAN